MKKNGWIKLHRSILDWEWFNDPDTYRVFTYLLLKVNHAPVKWQNITIERGQCVTSLQSIFDEINRNPSTQKLIRKTKQCTISNIRATLKRLISTNVITMKPTHMYSLITVVNYSKYQGDDSEATNSSTNTSTNELTQSQHSLNTVLTTNKNEKKKENDKKFLVLNKFNTKTETNVSAETFKLKNSEIPVVTKPTVRRKQSKVEDQLITELVEYFKQKLGHGMLDGSAKKNRENCYLLLKKVENNPRRVRLCVDEIAKNPRFKSYTSFKDIYYNVLKIKNAIEGGDSSEN